LADDIDFSRNPSHRTSGGSVVTGFLLGTNIPSEFAVSSQPEHRARGDALGLRFASDRGGRAAGAFRRNFEARGVKSD
jgi:hypothetical protein